ncbi:MAG: hypothetical protein QF793_03785 [Candidatus Peribacteraceae bacterium]|mgnify:CR=1 FL=1|jgi:hypothetical protein|nr:hypothetical protein [Candidatus Peribacteraceae bacterium]|tara:strand:+ start:36786 stop:36932 length:147 start_codon:yes stop_codon:yes gene_type:complete
MSNFFDDDGDDDDTVVDAEPMVETGDYDLDDDIGERIGKDDSSDNLPV